MILNNMVEEHKIYPELTVELLQQALLELKVEEPQFYKITDNLYCYRNKNTSHIGTLSFFEEVDKAVREEIEKVWQTSINR